MNSYSEILMERYQLNFPFVHAIEVTLQYVNSLPNAGAILQKFGEQVEILHQGPVPKKTYAQVGEFIVCFKDSNHKDAYVVVSAVAFKGLFKAFEQIQGDDQHPVQGHPIPYKETPGHGAAAYDDLHTGEPRQGKPATDTSTLSKESVDHQTHLQTIQGESHPPPLTEAQQKEQKRQERLNELKNSDMTIEEKPLGKGHKDI